MPPVSPGIQALRVIPAIVDGAGTLLDLAGPELMEAIWTLPRQFAAHNNLVTVLDAFDASGRPV
jgi:hypothetical protein